MYNLFVFCLEKIAKSILRENIYEIFSLYVPYLSEPKIILFLFSICSNLIDHDTSMNLFFTYSVQIQ